MFKTHNIDLPDDFTSGRIDAFPDNVAGLFYVNTDCIQCSLCDEIAPDVFRTSDDGDHNCVFAQPSTPGQLEQAMDALEKCPVEAIVYDSL